MPNNIKSQLLLLAGLILAAGCGTKENAERSYMTEKTVKPGPRPVVMGTCTMEPWEMSDTIDVRITTVLETFDRIAARAEEKKGKLDIVLFPEHIAHVGDRWNVGETIDGKLITSVKEKCRQYNTYAGVPLWLKEGEKLYNALVILDRKGDPVGTYKKVYPVISTDGTLEGGITPGAEFPVFDLDFGRVGVMICFDEFFSEGWDALGRKGAELILFTSAASAVSVLKSYAWRNNYYILASTFRAPTVIVDPIGGEVARTGKNMDVLVGKIDLDYRIIPWNSLTDFGKKLGKKYGDKIRQDWHYEEDLCILTSRRPDMPIQQVMDDENLFTMQEFIMRSRAKQNEERGGPPVYE